MLKLDDVDFGATFCATGARGFHGEGYPFHKYWECAGMCWEGTSFSGKTLTLLPRRGPEFGELGNMPLKSDGVTPKEFAPKCIYVRFHDGGEIINAVGLSNFGAKFYFKTGKYHKIDRPFSISIMLDAKDAAGREAELKELCEIIRSFMPFKAPVMLQINFGCPNSGHALDEFYSEICKLVEMAKAMLRIPVFINVNALMPTKVLIEASQIADGLWIGNTIPFGEPTVDGTIHWSRFGKNSPLRRRGVNGDGGLSSPSCLPFTIDKVQQLRDSGVKIPIVGGNGIRTIEDVSNLRRAGCNAVFIGSLAVVRPHRMKEIVAWSNFELG